LLDKAEKEDVSRLGVVAEMVRVAKSDVVYYLLDPLHRIVFDQDFVFELRLGDSYMN